MSNINAITGTEPPRYTQQTVADAGVAKDTGNDFSAILLDTVKESATRAGLAAGSSYARLPGEYMPLQNQGIEQMILGAASSGQVTDAQTALFMLCMMMQGDQDGDFSMIMQMMASMIKQLQGDAQGVRNTAMSSGYPQFEQDEIEKNVFMTQLPGGAGTGTVTLPSEVWKPATPAITSDETNRNPGLYRAVINQFRVESAERYKPFRDGYTYCNIFVWDVTAAMGAEIPHYINPDNGEPMYYPDNKGAKDMGAIAIDEWLKTYGSQYGWREVDAETAQRYANEGKPAVTSAGSLGHVQVVCPSRDGEFDPIRGAAVAQAGRIVTNYTYISGTYSANGQRSVSYFVHE